MSSVIHLLRNWFNYTSKRVWTELAKDLKPVGTAPSADAALDRFAEFTDRWEKTLLRVHPTVDRRLRSPADARRRLRGDRRSVEDQSWQGSPCRGGAWMLST